jgi:Polyketide cyclase / dehydrase and lipid transport
VTVEVGITIDAPPARVWDVVEPIERHVEWMADAVSITFTSAQHRGLGTAFDCATKVGPFRTTDRMVVTEWEPGQVIGIEHRGLITGTGRFTLHAIPDHRTHFTWTEQLRFPWWLGGRAGVLLAEPVLRRVWLGNLRRLAQLAVAHS